VITKHEKKNYLTKILKWKAVKTVSIRKARSFFLLFLESFYRTKTFSLTLSFQGPSSWNYWKIFVWEYFPINEFPVEFKIFSYLYSWTVWKMISHENLKMQYVDNLDQTGLISDTVFVLGQSFFGLQWILPFFSVWHKSRIHLHFSWENLPIFPMRINSIDSRIGHLLMIIPWAECQIRG
jgi:hypothetical protein